MERTEFSTSFPIGSKLPSFSLPDVGGKQFDSKNLLGAPAALVLFTCNHCPYVKGSDDMLIATVREYAERGLRAVAISSNDAAQYPEDSFELMKVKAANLELPFPYLYDESQGVAKSFDAACTPECYLFDGAGALVFHGTVNNSPRDPSKVTTNYLARALDQLLSGQKPDPCFINPLGCSIKWRR